MSLSPSPPHQLEARNRANETKAPVSPQMLHTLFAQQAYRHPENEAVVTPLHRLSYREVYTMANQISRWLSEQGAGKGSLVAVIMEKGWEQVVGVLGIINAGAAYLPIAADLPEERIKYIIKYADAGYILTQPHIEMNLETLETIKILSIDEQTLSPYSSEPLNVKIDPTDTAYVIFTSGSTGQPKGVVIDHQGAVNTIVDINSRFHVDTGDKVLALSALNFDLSVYVIFGLLAGGGTIVIPLKDSRRNPAHWLELIHKEKITIWNTVPALMEMLTEYTEGVNENWGES